MRIYSINNYHLLVNQLQFFNLASALLVNNLIPAIHFLVSQVNIISIERWKTCNFRSPVSKECTMRVLSQEGLKHSKTEICRSVNSKGRTDSLHSKEIDEVSVGDLVKIFSLRLLKERMGLQGQL